MPLVSSVDYVAKRIYLSVDSVGVVLDMMDVYREVRALRRVTEAHRGFRPMIVAGGNVEKLTGVTFTQPYVQLLYGCRIVPYDAAQQLKLIRDTFTDDGFAGRDVFDRTAIASNVDLDVDVPAVEVRVVGGGGGGGDPADVDAIATAVVNKVIPEPPVAGSVGEALAASQVNSANAVAMLDTLPEDAAVVLLDTPMPAVPLAGSVAEALVSAEADAAAAAADSAQALLDIAAVAVDAATAAAADGATLAEIEASEVLAKEETAQKAAQNAALAAALSA